MVRVGGKTEEEEKQEDLMNRACSLAVGMFGEDNVSQRLKGKAFVIYEDKIIVGILNSNNGEVYVKSLEYFDKAYKFAERYELEIIGREDGVRLRRDY